MSKSKFTLTLEARYIPDGTTVRKPTGTVEYRLERAINIYSISGKTVIPANNTVFLIGEGINEMSNDTRLSLDFDYIDELEVWVAQEFPGEVSA